MDCNILKYCHDRSFIDSFKKTPELKVDHLGTLVVPSLQKETIHKMKGYE